MKNDELTQLLTDLGLTESEAGVYISSLSIGPASVLKLARLSNIKRTTGYNIVSSLEEKGLMRTEVKGLKQLYVAENPEKLGIMLDRKKSEFQAKLPKLISLYNLKGGESTIKSYSGIEAMRNIYMETLKEIRPHEDYLYIANEEKWREVVSEKFALQYIEERAKMNVNTRGLVQPSDTATQYKKWEKNYNELIKILPEGTPLNVDTLLLPDKLITFELTPPFTTVVMENRSIVALHREMFELVWNSIE